MHQSLFLFVFCFLSGVSSTIYGTKTKLIQYSVPKATIKAFASKGFSVSIPDSPGLGLFAFHGNVNSKLGFLEAGMFSTDVLRPESGLWTYRDVTTKLKVGDTINYWLYVEKDGQGYRQDLQEFFIKELDAVSQSENLAAEVLVMEGLKPSTTLSGDIHHYHHYDNDSSAASQCQNEIKSHELFEKISNQLNVVLIQLQSLHDKTEPLKNKVDSLEQVIGELLKDEHDGTKLLLIGTKPPHDSNVYEAIRGVLTDVLDLHDLNSSIKFAEIVNNGIMFEVKSSIEKHRILVRAQERFNTDKRKIVDFRLFQAVNKSNAQVPEIYHRTDVNNEKSVKEKQPDIADIILFE